MKIRKGTIKDLTELHKLVSTTKELQGSENSAIYSLDFIKDTLKDKKMNIVLIAEENNKIMGFLMAETWHKKGYSFLTELFVYSEHRRKGVASSLTREFEKYCLENNIKKIVSLVLESNKIMQTFQNRSNYNKGNLMYYYEKELQ